MLTRWMNHASEFASPHEGARRTSRISPTRTADIAEAKKLMAARGPGRRYQNVRLRVGPVAPHAEILHRLPDELRRTLGIETKIRVMERALLIEELKKGTFD